MAVILEGEMPPGCWSHSPHDDETDGTMHRLLLLLLIVVSLISGCQAQDTSQPTTLPPIEVFFSPKGGCTEAVVRELNAAKSSVLVQAYSFTSAPIAKALLEAHKRGTRVEVMLGVLKRMPDTDLDATRRLARQYLPNDVDDLESLIAMRNY